MNKPVVACLFGLALFAAGCGKSKAVVAAEQYEKDACACKDSACATAVSTKFTTEMSKGGTPTSSSDAAAYSKAVSAAGACVAKVAAVMPAK